MFPTQEKPLTLEKKPQFRSQLIRWFRTHQRRLPWRQTRDPYQIWVSEVMLQQTQVKTVLTYYQRFLERFPDIRHLAAADLQEVLKGWEGMGYYGRARNLHRAAQMIVNDMGGKIPSQYQVFRRLPGVGEYIGAAVQSLAFDQPRAVLDGNVKRVVSRLFLMDSPLNTTSSLRLCKQRVEDLLDPGRPGLFNQAMMELGATICHPRKPRCPVCPVSRFCQAYHTKRQNEIPVIPRTRSIPEHHVVAGIVCKNSHLLITRRKPAGLLGGLWEFPGGKVRMGETAREACIREIREEVNLAIEIVDRLTRVKHAYTHFRIVMDIFRCRYRSGEVVLKGPVDHRWITVEEVDRFPFPAANHKFIPLLKKQVDKGLCQRPGGSLKQRTPAPEGGRRPSEKKV